MDLTTVRFGVGNHDATDSPTGERDLCIMEAVSFMAGEPWGDKPACASPVVSEFLRNWNDTLSNDDRDRLLPADKWVPRLVGSRGDAATEQRRAYLALDWLIRVHTPAWLDLTPSLAGHATALRALPEVVDLTTAENAVAVVNAAWSAARDARAAREAAWHATWAAQVAASDAAWAAQVAAREAAEAAAGGAAWSAAREAASDAAWSAAGAAAGYAVDTAWSAARVAAGAAARDAARAAASDAAWGAARAAEDAARVAASDAASDAAWGAASDAAWAALTPALRPTVEKLHQSALDLLDQMLLCGGR